MNNYKDVPACVIVARDAACAMAVVIVVDVGGDALPTLCAFVDADGDAWISSVYVPPQMRRQRHATRLLAACATLCRCMHLDDMTTAMQHARNVYTRAGFVYAVEGYPEMTARASTVRSVVARMGARHGCAAVRVTCVETLASPVT